MSELEPTADILYELPADTKLLYVATLNDNQVVPVVSVEKVTLDELQTLVGSNIKQQIVSLMAAKNLRLLYRICPPPFPFVISVHRAVG